MTEENAGLIPVVLTSPRRGKSTTVRLRGIPRAGDKVYVLGLGWRRVKFTTFQYDGSHLEVSTVECCVVSCKPPWGIGSR